MRASSRRRQESNNFVMCYLVQSKFAAGLLELFCLEGAGSTLCAGMRCGHLFGHDNFV